MVFACFFLWPSSAPVTLVRRGWRQFFLPANGCSVCQDWKVAFLRVHRAERGGRAKGSPFLVSSPLQLWRGDVEALLLCALGGPNTSASCSVTFLGVKLTGTNF